ncbi:MAG: RNA polymerase sigma factor (sigma-70 family) [Myxococcota bacterium]|jgi:RNA polymerase sigma factor (sigma-70 family)
MRNETVRFFSNQALSRVPSSMTATAQLLAPWIFVGYHHPQDEIMASSDSFFDGLRDEMALRARLLLSGSSSKAGRMTPDDLVQEAFAKLLTAYGEESLRSREHNSLMALAYRTMRNLVIDQGRKKGAYLASDDDERNSPKLQLVDNQPMADEQVIASATSRHIAKALEGLEGPERCFILQVLETDSVPKAQKHCGWPPKSPYYQLRRLMDHLRDVLTPALGRQ